MSYTFRTNMVSSSKYNIKCPYPMSPIGICIHNTANSASADAEVRYMINNNNQVSYHVAVDEKEVIQAIPFNRNAWASGDGASGTGNIKYIHIEICRSTGDVATFKKCEQNCAEYVAKLLKQYGWTTANIKQHHDFANKNCPHKTRELGWQRFVNMVQAELNKLNGVAKPTTQHKPQAPTQQEVNKVNYTVRIKVSSLNVRQYPSLDAKVITTVRKNEVYTITEEKWSGGVKFGHLKSGRGWISLGADYVEKNNQTTKANSFRIKVVNCTSLNARKEPNGKIVETVKKGTILTIVGEVDGWYRTKSGLFVSKTYCQRLD